VGGSFHGGREFFMEGELDFLSLLKKHQKLNKKKFFKQKNKD